jgi:hypothetical protein
MRGACETTWRTVPSPENQAASQLPFVHLAPMCNAGDAHELRCLVDDVDHTPVTNADAPVIFVTLSFLHPDGRGDSCKDSSFRITRASKSSESSSSSFCAAGFTSGEYLPTQSTAFYEVRFDLFEWDAFFFAT